MLQCREKKKGLNGARNGGGEKRRLRPREKMKKMKVVAAYSNGGESKKTHTATIV